MCKHECCEATNVQARMPLANVFDVLKTQFHKKTLTSQQGFFFNFHFRL